MTRAKANPDKELVLLGQAGIARTDIDLQVEKICSSPAFDDRDKSREVFRFLVDEALAGRVPEPAGIAANLGKSDFSRGDAYVRTTVGRLRKSMKTYYETCATSGEMRLEIPDRQYFVLAPRSPMKPRLAGRPAGTNAGITEPIDGAEVFQRVPVRGRITVLDRDLRVWLTVGTPCGDFYPQCQVSRNNPEWDHEVRIGRLQWGTDEGAEYEIFLVAMRTDGDAAFYQYLKSGRDGFGPLLPTDAFVLDSRRVIRRDIRAG